MSAAVSKNKHKASSFGTMCFTSFLAISVIVCPSDDLLWEQCWPKENQHLRVAVGFVCAWSAWLCCQQAYSDQHSESSNLATLPWQCVPCSTISWTWTIRPARCCVPAGKCVAKEQCALHFHTIAMAIIHNHVDWDNFKLLWSVYEVCVVFLQFPERSNSADDPY